MTELFPQLAGLKGGVKQHWVNTNLDFITLLNDNLGFDETCRVLHMKADTLASALKRAEDEHRPAITRADKAYSLAQRAEVKADESMHELAVQAEALIGSVNEVGELKQNLTSYFKLLAEVNSVMARLCQATINNLTYHIDSPPKYKVGLTKRLSRGRLSVSNPVSHQLTGAKMSVRHRSHFKRRWPRV